MKKLQRAGIMSICIAFLIILCDPAMNAGPGKTKKKGAGQRAKVTTVTDEYYEKWKIVEGHDSKGKPRSALEEVEKILALAKKERNAPHAVKALIYRVKYTMQIGEKEHPEILRMLEKEAAAAQPPEKQVLQSLLAEAYWNYFAAHRYQFYNRTATVNFKEDDIATWSLGKLLERVSALHTGSLAGSAELKKIPLGMMDALIIRGSAPRGYRPTLYDFLAHRAVDFFMNDESKLTVPAYEFEIDSADYFKPAEQFASLKLSAKDASSLRFNALLVLQELTRFHLADGDGDPGALVDVELKRLMYVRDKAVIPEKESLYIRAIQELERRHDGHESSALVSYEIARWFAARGGEWKEGDPDDHQWSVKKSADICAGTMRKFPVSEGARLCGPYTTIDKSLSITLEKINVAGKPFRALVKYKNINRLHLRLIPLSAGMMEYYRDSQDSMEKKVIRLLEIKPASEWSETLPDDGDLRTHSVEVPVPGQAFGHYALLGGTDGAFSMNGNAVAYMTTQVSNLSFVHRLSSEEGAVFHVYDRDSGEPVKDAAATVTERYYDYSKSKYVTRILGTPVSDSTGFLRVPLEMKSGYYYNTLNISLKKGKDSLQSDFYSYINSRESSAAYKSFFFTDRSIYRPGQKIFFKAILLGLAKEDSYRVLADQGTTVEFLDHNGQKVGEVTLRSNQYGTVSGSFTAPAGVLTGQMTLRNGSGYSVIRVEEYKRPKFEALFKPVKGNYRLGESIKAVGSARSYSGAPLTEATVKYTVVRKVWFLYRWWGWYYWHYNNQEMVIKRGEARTDARGEFTVDFEAQPDRRIPKSEQPAFYYTIHADVTDINGETHGADTVVRAGYIALMIGVTNLPSSVDAGKPLALELSSTNFSGEDVPAAGSISISRVREPERLIRYRLWDRPDRQVMKKEEFVKKFPHDAYRDEEDQRTRGIEKKCFSSEFDVSKSKKVALPDLASWPDGDYVLEIDTRDSYGEKIHYERNFSIYSPREEAFARKAYLYFTPLEQTVEPGGEIRFLVGSHAKQAYLLLDIVRRGARTEKMIVKLESGKKLVSVPVREEDRGNINYRYALIQDNRLWTGNGTIYVPWTNKELKAEFMTFRNKLAPGEKEEWRIKISGRGGEKIAAELVTAMYDASLDSFYPHYWFFNVNPQYYNYNNWNSNITFSTEQSGLISSNWYSSVPGYHRYYDSLNLFGVYFYSRGKNYRYRSMRKGDLDSAGAVSADEVEESAAEKKEAKPSDDKSKDKQPAPSPDKREEDGRKPIGGETSKDASVQIRKNLNETAFFFPHLATDENGEIIVSFSAPEALTRWKIMGFAHTVDLKNTVFIRELVTQKDLMVSPNVPRFLREGDTVVISSKISNLTDKKLSGTAELLLFDAVTMKPLDRELSNDKKSAEFTAPEKGNAAVNWTIRVPESLEGVTWRVVARAGNFSDGEEAILPVLSNRIMVTESMPLPVRGKQKKEFQFKKLMESGNSSSLSHYRLTLEFTSNPAWYAVQALPYLMEFPHECAEQVFSRFYANSLATHIVNASPRIKEIFEQWKNSDALLSNLQKNEELKSVLIQETPWLLNGRSEEQNKKRVGLLFDLNRMAGELGRAHEKLRQMQGYNGGWPWFPGLPESWYISQHILAGIAKLRLLGVAPASKEKTAGMTDKGVQFIDVQMKESYDSLIRYRINLKQKNIGYMQYHYLYTRSFFKEIPVPEKYREAFNYWKGQAVKYWPTEGPYAKGMISIGLHRFGEKQAPKEIIESLREHAINSEELGMYWKENVGGYWWYQAPLETQALLIEAFDEVARDRKSVDDMRTWLVKMKQVQHWGTTKATTDACYALLMGGSDWLKNDQLAEILLNDTKVDPAAMGAKTEAGTGYFKVSWKKEEIRPDMGRVTVINKNDGPAWGSLYWQYFERMDRITPHETPLKLEKKLFLVVSTDRGPVLEPITDTTRLKPGDRLKVRIVLRVDRDMDYVHMKDLRASGTEPENVLSRHRYQDGLWYYESTKDTATHFFIERLPKGTFVFEYPLMVNLKGDFSAGITTIQCMYAPEFTSHSEGIRLKVE